MRQSGPPAQVYDHPADLFVANFVGSPGMNFFAGEVVMDEYLGSCRNIHVHTACGRLALRVGDDQRFGLGERVALNFDAEQVRFFAADTGEKL